MKKPEPIPAHTSPMLPIGTKVLVLRPNLWFGATGEVARHEDNKHFVKIPAKGCDGFFHCIANRDELKEIKE